MKKYLIAAAAENNAIGAKGQLPWHVSEDWKYFMQTTMGHPIIMGRTSWDSLPKKPLPGRVNLVLSSRKDLALPEGVILASSLQDAYKAFEGEEFVFIIGGASVYAQAIDDADRIYLTRLYLKVEDADAFFPAIDPAKWKRVSCSERRTDARSGVDYEFEIYERL